MPGIGDLINAALGYRGPLDLLPREPGPRVTPEGALDAGAALTGAKVKPEQKSEFEQTLAPGEWEQMTPRERFDRLHMQLGQMAEGAAMMAGGGGLPALGAHLPEKPGAPGSRTYRQSMLAQEEAAKLAKRESERQSAHDALPEDVKLAKAFNAGSDHAQEHIEDGILDRSPKTAAYGLYGSSPEAEAFIEGYHVRMNRQAAP